jgi:hypothetical protein
MLRFLTILRGAQGRLQPYLQILDSAKLVVNWKHSCLFGQQGYTALASGMSNFNLKLKQLPESNTLYYFAYDKVSY